MQNLSKAGRTVSSQSVASAIPAYSMMSILVPKRVCQSIDAIIRDF